MLISLIQGPPVNEECAKQVLCEILALMPERQDQSSFLLRILREESSPQACAAITLLFEKGNAEALPSLIACWQQERRGDVLRILENAILKLNPADNLALSLLSYGSAAYIGSRYGIKNDDMLEYFQNNEVNLNLLMQGLRGRAGAINIPQGTQIVVHRYGEYEPPTTLQLISSEEFEKVVLRLTVTIKNETLGIFTCLVGERESDEVLKLVFGEGTGAAFWAYIE